MDTGDSTNNGHSGESGESGDTGKQLDPVLGDPDFVCPIVEGVPEQSLGVELTERPELNGHGWRVVLQTELPALATVFFAPSERGDPCLHALSTGWFLEDHALELTNLRLGTSYDLVVKLTDLDGNVTRSAVLGLQTEAPDQPLPEEFGRLGVDKGALWFDATFRGAVPSDLVISTNLGLCGLPYGSPSSGVQALLLDFEGYLVGDYVASEVVQGFGQIHTSFSGGLGYASGNEDVVVHIGGGIPQRSNVARVDLLGNVGESVLQPAISESNYSLNYLDFVIEDTAALEATGITFEGTAHLSVISRNEDFVARSTATMWDEGLVTQDNAEDPDAWTVWAYETVDLTSHPKTLTYSNSVFYDPVRNEVIAHTHSAHGGMIWGVDVVEQRVVWVFGFLAEELEGYVSEDTVIISEVQEPGACEQPFFARAHYVASHHGDDQDPSSFFLTMHDNGGDGEGRRYHTRAIVYHIELDEEAGTGTAAVHWAYPSNPLDVDDPMYEAMGYHNYVYGSLEKVPTHDELYLLTSGSGYCYEDTNEQGMPTREQITLLQALPDTHSAEVLATYVPGSSDLPWVNLYAASATTLYAPVGSQAGTSGRRSFQVTTEAP